VDKYEYQVCADQIKSLSSEGRYAEAMDIADTIDWRRVKSFSMLCTVSEIYKVNKHYDESREILLLAYERYPDRASVIYALCELDIKLGDIKEAKEFYKEYVALKPNDTNRYVLLYRLYEAMDYTLEEKISLLEEFKRAEYTEKWAYELAVLYHKTGQERKCVETCDELILWFGDGNYVRKAMELKMQHSNLSEDQQRKYDGVGSVASYAATASHQTSSQSIQPQNYQNTQQNMYQNGFQNTQQDMYQNGFQNTQQNMYQNGFQNTQQDMYQNVYQNTQQDMYYQQGYGQNSYQQTQYDQYGNPISSTQQMYDQSYVNQQPAYDNYQGIQVQPISTGKYSTINLQEELARNMQEIYDRSNPSMVANYYGNTSSLYEPSQQEYMQNLENAGIAPMTGNDDGYYTGDMQTPYQDGYYQGEPEEEQLIEMPMPVIEQSSVAVPSIESSAVVAPLVPTEEELKVEETVKQSSAAEEAIAEPVKEEAAPSAAPSVQPLVPSDNKTMEKNLSQEYNGQISMSLPDPDVEIKQITGQIDISDFLKEWEEKKANAKQQSYEATRRRQIEQTNDIMSQLAGVIPGIELKTGISSQKSAPEEPSQKEEVVRSDEQGTLTKTTIKAPKYDMERPVKRTETGTIINGGPVKSGITSAIPDVLSSAEDVVEDEIKPVLESSIKPAIVPVVAPVAAEEANLHEAPIVRKNTPQEEKPIKIPDYILEQIALERGEEPQAYTADRVDKEPEEDEAPVTENIEIVDEAVAETFEEESEVTEAEVTEAEVTEGEPEEAEAETVESEPKEIEAEIAESEPEEIEAEITESEPEEIEAEITESEPEETEAETTESIPEENEIETSENTFKTAEVSEDENEESEEVSKSDKVVYPFEVTDTGEVEEIEEIEQTDEVDDILKTGAIPLFDIEQAEYEAGIESAEEKKPAIPSYMVINERRVARREFYEDELRIFGRFEGIESLKAQIVDVMDDMSMDADIGNVVVTGSEMYGRKSIAIDIVKAMQSMDMNFSGKVAKISGEALNKKDIPMTLHKLHNGALIVENAGGLSPLTVNAMTECLTRGAEPILVVLEDEVDAMEPLLNGCKDMKEVFNARIEMEDFSNDDLVSYARGYAREQEYSIDEMGELALHTRISEIQASPDGVVTVEDVKDMVDTAIRHVDKKNMSHFMDVLLAKRYDDDDYIILREKDFNY